MIFTYSLWKLLPSGLEYSRPHYIWIHDFVLEYWPPKYLMIPRAPEVNHETTLYCQTGLFTFNNFDHSSWIGCIFSKKKIYINSSYIYVSQVQKPGVSRIHLTLNALLEVPTLQLTSNTLKPKWIIMSFPTSLVLAIFMAALPSNFRFCNIPHVCHSKFEGTASSWSRSESSFLSDRFRYWKSALCKTEGFCKYESLLCHNHAVTMLTQPGHVDEHLKEQLMSQNKENGNFSWKMSKV